MREQHENKRIYNSDETQDVSQTSQRNDRSEYDSHPRSKTPPNRKPRGFDRDFDRDHNSRSCDRDSNSDVGDFIENVKQQQMILKKAVHKLNVSNSDSDPSTAKQLKDMLSIVLEQTNKLQTKLPLITTPSWASPRSSSPRCSNSDLKRRISPVRYLLRRSPDHNMSRRSDTSPSKFEHSPHQQKYEYSSSSRRRHESPSRSSLRHYTASSPSRRHEQDHSSSRYHSRSSRRSVSPHKRYSRSRSRSPLSYAKQSSRYSVSPRPKDSHRKRGHSPANKRHSPSGSYYRREGNDWMEDSFRCKKDHDEYRNRNYSLEEWDEIVKYNSKDYEQIKPTSEDRWSGRNKKISDYELFKKKWEKERAMMADEIGRLRKEVSDMKKNRVENREERDKHSKEGNEKKRKEGLSVKDRIGIVIDNRYKEEAVIEWEIGRKAPNPLSLSELEWELSERRNKKKNVFIKGYKCSGKGMQKELEELIEEATGTKPKVIKFKLAGRGVLLELWSFKNKMAIMKRRAQLRKWNMWLEDELTWRERQIQLWIEARAEVERNKGKDVRTGYMKMKIDGEWMVWDELKGKLEKSYNGNNSKWNFREEYDPQEWDGNRWNN